MTRLAVGSDDKLDYNVVRLKEVSFAPPEKTTDMPNEK